MTRVRFLILAFAVMLAGSAAHADDLKLGPNYVPVTIDEGGVGATNVGGGPITISFLNGSPLAYVYCVGFFTDVYVPDDYPDTVVTNNGFVNGAFVNHDGEIAWLLNIFAVASLGSVTNGKHYRRPYGVLSTTARAPRACIQCSPVIRAKGTIHNTKTTSRRLLEPAVCLLTQMPLSSPRSIGSLRAIAAEPSIRAWSDRTPPSSPPPPALRDVSPAFREIDEAEEARHRPVMVFRPAGRHLVDDVWQVSR